MMAGLIDYEKMAESLMAMRNVIYKNSETLDIDVVLRTIKQIDDSLVPLDIAHSLNELVETDKAWLKLVHKLIDMIPINVKIATSSDTETPRPEPNTEKAEDKDGEVKG